MSIQLIHGDCLEEMKKLPDKSIDLFICDLPYGCLIGGGGQEKKRRRFQNGKDTGTLITQTEGVIAGCSWDIKIDLDAFWIQVERLMKDDHTPIIHFCNTRFGNDLINSKPKWFRYDLIWNKSNGVGFLSANKMPMRSHELIYVFAKKGARYNRIDIEGDFKGTSSGKGRAGGDVYNLHKRISVSNVYPAVKDCAPTREGIRCVKSVIDMSNKKGKGKHPTQKPDDLYKWLIERYSNPGDTILDPTAGSFASCFTAKTMGRNAIGMEMDKVFYDKANNLVEE
jgi:site-specific DNA-methyltransferase (adenine-specific)